MIPILFVCFFIWIIIFWVLAGMWLNARGNLETYLKNNFPDQYENLQPKLSTMESIFGNPKGIDQTAKDKILFGDKIHLDEQIINLQNKYKLWSKIVLGYVLGTILIIFILIKISG